MTINRTQNAQLHLLLNQTKMTEMKPDLVSAFTDGRSSSSRDMLATEAQELINYLKSLDNTIDAANNMRRKILSMCHRIQWEDKEGNVDVQRLNDWCEERSYLKKPLMHYKYNELPKLVSEFQQVYKHYIRKASTV